MNEDSGLSKTMDRESLPTIIVPYTGPAEKHGYQDIFICLRPETNGIKTESTMLKVIKSTEEYSNSMKLIFLANFPGQFIMDNTIIEQYCALKLHFSVAGKHAFTPFMVESFENYFGVSFESCDLISPFVAMQRFSMSADELFALWVAEKDICIIHGQSIKKIHGSYVVNYDIPGLLHKNTRETDIAVMQFRTSLSCLNLRKLFQIIHQEIVNTGIATPQCDMKRYFHYSRSPLEQIMDSLYYIYTPNRTRVSLNDFTFSQYLLNRGFSAADICSILMNPIVNIKDENGQISEVNLFQYTAAKTYKETLRAIERIVEQKTIVHHGPLLQAICPELQVLHKAS